MQPVKQMLDISDGLVLWYKKCLPVFFPEIDLR